MFRLIAAGLAAGAILLACAGDAPLPGQALGQFQFAATEIADDCDVLREKPEARDGGAFFEFRGDFSEEPDAGRGYFTLNGISRAGTFDGQRFEATLPAPESGSPGVRRTFELLVEGCGTEHQVTETMRVVFLSPSQMEALGGACLGDVEVLLADGGVPVDPDANIHPPKRVPEFDALHACGILSDRIVPAEPCAAFSGCTLVYRIHGTRVLE